MKLLVIGNGVDIALGYPTKAIDCDKWLKKESQKNHDIKLLFSYVQTHYKGLELSYSDLWQDIENNLTKVDRPPKNINSEKWYNWKLWKYIYRCFQAWVNYICIYVKNHDIYLRTKGDREEYKIIKNLLESSNLVFDFNYTDTLKYHLNVSENKIIHIHGTRRYPVLGHKGKEIIHDVHSKNTFYDMTLKKTRNCFIKHTSKFSQPHVINRIVFIGVSYGKVDWPYYCYMKNLHVFTKSCIGIFYYHSKNSRSSAQELCEYLHNCLHVIKNSPNDKQYFKLDH